MAERAVRLFGSRNRVMLAASAAVVLTAAAVAGVLLADSMDTVREKIIRTRIIRELDTFSEKGRIVQVLADPRSPELLMGYINSMAGAVTNMEVSADWRLEQFLALLDTTRALQISIETFSYDETMTKLSVECAAREGADPLALTGKLENTGVFSKVEFDGWDNLDQRKFTICCYFT